MSPEHHRAKRLKLDDEPFSVAPRQQKGRHGPNHAARSRFTPTSSRAATPTTANGGATPRQEEFDGPEPLIDDDYARALDRDWYGGDEDGHALGDDTHNPFGGADAVWEEEPTPTTTITKSNYKGTSTKQAQRQKDTEAWEKNRMLTSGIAQRKATDIDLDDDEEETRVHLMVHELRPPFLDGHTVFTKQLEPISAVLNPQSDLAVCARKGSQVVKERRQQKERQKQAQEATSMKGSALGNIMGVKEDDTDSAAHVPGEDGKTQNSSNKFADHLKKEEGQSNFSRGKTMAEQRQFLPAYAKREEFLRIVREHSVIVVVGQTGSGKSTQLCQFLYEDGYGSQGMIGITQPRRVAAMSVAKRVSQEMEVKLGGLVGYSIRFEDCTSPATRIKFCTEGVMLRESLVDPDLDKYSCILLDEAHERSTNTDILMGLFKTVLARRRDLKLIVTSATLNSERFSKFFGSAPEFHIEGRTFHVDQNFAKSPVTDYCDAAVKQALAIHVSQGAGDILIFMTGQEDIEACCEIMDERLKLLNDPPKLSILPIYSQMPADLQAKIFDRAPPGVRKVIVATNIAETSLTVDGIKYVVDCGFSKLKTYNPQLKLDALSITPIAQANCMQRCGRAGRTQPGQSYHLYTERAFKEEMYVQQIPEIQRTNLSPTLLLIKSLGVKDLLDFPFLDPPPQDQIAQSLFDLWALGALDNIGDLTPLGKRMTAFPMDPSLAKLIITSEREGCSEEVLTIVAMLSVPSVYYRPKERQEEADAAREKFFVQESDHLTLLHVYTQWKMNGYSDAWCVRHFLHPKALRRAKEIREQVADIMKMQNVELASCGTDWDVVRKVICAGFYHQAAKVKGIGEYINLRTSVTVQLHPTSALSGLGYLPDYVIYHELVLTSKEWMSCVTAVDPYWLADMGGVFYAVKEKGYSARDRRVTEMEFNRKAELEAKMAEDKQREAERRAKEQDLARPTTKKPATVVKKPASHGLVKRPVIRKGGRGF